MRRLALLLAALCGGGADLDAPMPMLKVTLHHGGETYVGLELCVTLSTRGR